MKIIVYIDDEQALLDTFPFFFEDGKYQVFTFNNHNSALEYFKDKHTDFLFVDYRMPDGTALDIIAQLSPKLGQSIKVLISGEITFSDEVKTVFDYIVEKPFDIEDILKIINSHS